MDILILFIVIIGTFLVIASGVWVAIALISAISTHQDKTNKVSSDSSA